MSQPNPGPRVEPRSYEDLVRTMDPDVRRILSVAAVNAGFVGPDSEQEFCEMIALAGRLGTISLQQRSGRPDRGT